RPAPAAAVRICTLLLPSRFGKSFARKNRAGRTIREYTLRMHWYCTTKEASAARRLAVHHALQPARDHQFHLVFQAQLYFFQGYFESEILRTHVRLLDQLFELRFTAGVFFSEAPELHIIFQQGLPDIVRRNRHSFPPVWRWRLHSCNNYHKSAGRVNSFPSQTRDALQCANLPHGCAASSAACDRSSQSRGSHARCSGFIRTERKQRIVSRSDSNALSD